MVMKLEGHGGDVISVAFSPDGRLLAAGSWDNSTRIWQASDGKMLIRLVGHSRPVYSVAFSPDSRLVATGAGDATVRIWELSL